MADQACFSPFHFHRIFQDAVGETPTAFLERLRLERAALMLLASEEPITGLALEVGFRRPETFARRFRAAFGCSARDYRSRQIALWAELGMDAGRDPLGRPGEITAARLPELRIEVRRSIGEEEGFDFNPASAPWNDGLREAGASRRRSAGRIGATLDWAGITPPGHVRQDWGRTLDGGDPAAGWVRRSVGGGLYAKLRVEGTGPVPPVVHQRLFVRTMAGRYRLRPGAILEIQEGDGILVHQPVRDHGEG
jgi:AraC family transcriptional regulator